MTQPLSDVVTHHRVPITHVGHHSNFAPSMDPGVTKFRAQLSNKIGLDALLINKESETLVVSFHGAASKGRKLPRFEWMRTVRDTPYSSLYFADPCLELDDELLLAWYTGWKELDLYPILAHWIIQAASAVQASNVVLFGSSGGGFATLQISALIPGSLAIPFNTQTSISRYKVSGRSFSAQEKFLEIVMPHLRPDVPLEELEPELDWAEPLGDRLSAITRYSRPLDNYVYYVQNSNDSKHVEQHYEPFRKVVETGPNRDRIRFVSYNGPVAHKPPSKEQLVKFLDQAISWRQVRPAHNAGTGARFAE